MENIENQHQSINPQNNSNNSTTNYKSLLTKKPLLEIDGSILEGGGQIIRISVSLSFLLNIPIKITNIRAKRDNPGLQRQHLTCTEFIIKTFKATEYRGLAVNSKELSLKPTKLYIECPKKIECTLASAGSIGLMIQEILPCLLFTSISEKFKGSDFDVYFTGGTLCKFCPTIYYLNDVLFPILNQHMGVNAKCNLKTNGLYPKGGGQVYLHLAQANTHIKSINVEEKGKLKNAIVRFCNTQNFRFKIDKVKDEVFKKAKKIIRNEYLDSGNTDDFDNEIIKIENVDLGNNSFTFLFQCIYVYENTSIKAEYLYSEKKWADITMDDMAENCENAMLKAIENNVICFDEHTVDHLIIFMALAQGKSRISVGELSMHTKTAIEIIKQFIPGLAINIIPSDDKKHISYIIEIEGIGYSLIE